MFAQFLHVELLVEDKVNVPSICNLLCDFVYSPYFIYVEIVQPLRH